MARGFGSTLGAGSTDIITSTLAAKATQRSYHLKVYRLGDGGGGFGRMWEDAAGIDLFLYNAGTYSFTRGWSSSTAEWSVSAPSTSTWVDIVLTYDGGSTSNDPVIYFDGVSQSVIEGTEPGGTLTTTSGAYAIGNRASDSARNWDGLIAEFSVWDSILNAGEANALSKGYSGLLIRPQSLVEHIPMIRDNVSWKRGAPTITATGIQPHPRVIYPGGGRVFSGSPVTGDQQRALAGTALAGATGTPAVVFSIAL